MNVFEFIASVLRDMAGFVLGFWDSLLNVGLDLGALLYGEILDFALGAFALCGFDVCNANVISQFQWPSAGPLGPLLRACGLPEAVSILACCWGIRLLLKATVVFG